MENTTLGLAGLSCVADSHHVERALARVPGVSGAVVNPVTNTAYVRYDPTRVGLEGLAAAVERAGFSVRRPSERCTPRTSGDGTPAAVR